MELVIIAVVVICTVFCLAQALCRASSWHVRPQNYDEVNFWRRRRP